MKYIPLNIPDIILMKPQVFGDHRGFFMETFREDDFRANAADVNFVQDNHSKSTQGILRGLHYQIKHPQGKLVRVTSGEVFDAAVDIRKSSPFFGKWSGAVLSAENKHMLWIPPGFAHGFYVLSHAAEFTYKCTDYWAPEHERSILWNDPAIAIDWPIIPGSPPILSQKDGDGSPLKTAEVFA
ncbi:MAG: dTDP-4-dehydrorhamnose 3,5-epimerase [Proteobacteria bacterium]|nr:dTDP-4-dehydrorhamnose 3,5-epimerase [Pseudomonadota bacterium]MBU1582403.1 dTDP-4-dehydrorhamnose 3,5-epimerase [Pseudomonadota bacterium]MBU2454564.1 dTDP-4-dehydrorhamnose 3,5-epimerase [Pseudomonadota bacterium]MBU2630372.1 dTDP-4-dehydrorhamnose 3,5-epimerase [Pseudomonadota bacterium]